MKMKIKGKHGFVGAALGLMLFVGGCNPLGGSRSSLSTGTSASAPASTSTPAPTPATLQVQIGGPGATVTVSSSEMDASGNIIVAGTFNANLNTGLTLSVTGTRDLFVAKFERDGTLVWAKSFGSAGVAADGIRATAGTNDEVTVFGVYRGTVDAGGGGVAAVGTNGAFLARYDANGGYLWSRFFNGTGVNFGANKMIGSLAVDSGGDIAVAVRWVTANPNTVDFGGGAVTGNGWTRTLIAKYDGSDGTQIWQKNLNAGAGEIISEGQYGNSIAFDSNKNLLAFFTQNHLPVDYGDIAGVPGSGITDNPAAFNQYALTLAKFGASTGETQWVKMLYGVTPSGYTLWNGALQVDSAGNAIVAFFLAGEVEIGHTSTVTAGDAVNGDTILAKYSGSNGAHVWHVNLGSSIVVESAAISIEAGNQVLLGARLTGSTTISGNALTSAGGWDALALRYASNGTFVSVNQHGSAGGDHLFDSCSDATSTVGGLTFSAAVTVNATNFNPVGTTDALIFVDP